MKTKYLTLLALIAAFNISCSKSDSTAENEEKVELPMVELDVAVREDVDQAKSYTATVEAFNVNNISPAVGNRIKTITVDVGDRVHKGQVLVTLDPTNVDQIKLSLDNAQREYDRAVQLLNIGAGTQQAVDQLKTQLDAYRAQYNNQMENTVLVSPISGVVTARNYDPGDMCGGQPILTVGQITPSVKVMINVTENDYSKFKTGMPTTVTLDAFPDQVFNGKVERIYPTVDPQTRTFPVEILINNPEGKILPGMFARVDLNLGSANHVVVSDRAIVKQTGSGNRYIYVYSNGHVSFNQVELGQRMGNRYELISGIEEGDTIVVTGQSRLADGIAVEVVSK